MYPGVQGAITLDQYTKPVVGGGRSTKPFSVGGPEKSMNGKYFTSFYPTGILGWISIEYQNLNACITSQPVKHT